jgi:hypothetical protein
MPQLLSTLGKDPVPIVQEAGWAPGPVRTTGVENLASTRIRFPDCPTCSQSLYQLSYPVCSKNIYICIIKRLVNVGPELWSGIEISELLYFTLNQCSQFSSLSLLMWTESPKSSDRAFFGSICRSPVFELGRCCLESIYCDDMFKFDLWVLRFWKQKRVMWN